MKRNVSAKAVAAVTVATGVLVVGAGGGAVGAALITSKDIKNNTIKSVDVKDNQLSTVDVKDNSLGSVDVRDNSLGSADVKDGTLTGADLKDGTVGEEDLTKAAKSFWAVVNANGSLARSSGGVTSADTGTGAYEVVFPVDVRQCAYVASAGSSGASGSPPKVSVGALGRAGEVKGIWVETWNDAGANVDAGFHVIVDC
jgi:hypothetical protein